MALHGEGEPQANAFQRLTQALTIALFAQWQTYNNGVHMDWDTFRSIDFEDLARAAYGPASEWLRENAERDSDSDSDRLREVLTTLAAEVAKDGQAPKWISERLAFLARADELIWGNPKDQDYDDHSVKGELADLREDFMSLARTLENGTDQAWTRAAIATRIWGILGAT